MCNSTQQVYIKTVSTVHYGKAIKTSVRGANANKGESHQAYCCKWGGAALKRARLEIIFSVKVNAGFIVFATDEQIRLLGECSSLHMDGTFKTCPRPFAQVTTVKYGYLNF